MRYAIIANPVSGRLSAAERRKLLAPAAHILKATVHGLDTRSAGEFADRARSLAAACDVLVVAGGDGTFSQLVNALGPSPPVMAYLPLGTGNALSHALGFRQGLSAAARRIRAGTIRDCDLIDCDGKRSGFMVSVGIDGAVIRRFDRYRACGSSGLPAHIRAGLAAYFRDYCPAGATITVDGAGATVSRLLSLAILKQPFFGMGLKVAPGARWDDGRLHTRCLTGSWPTVLGALATGFTVGNRLGRARTGRAVTLSLEKPLAVQVDGEFGWVSDRFTFRVLPGALRLKY
ncbi:MAG: diacylglycerol kinase family protein [Pseudomonadota bacterium]